jgi:acyl-ACP thioesterase
MARHVYTETFKIRSYEAGPGGAATLPALANLLQESAANHAVRLGVSMRDLARRNLTWMLSRLHLQVTRYPAFGEEVTIETWPSDRKKYHAYREFLFTGTEDREIARATSAWLVIDLSRKRPVSLENNVEYPVPERSRMIEDDFPRLPAVGSGPVESADAGQHSDDTAGSGPTCIDFKVSRFDLDVNDHVNSVRYIQWCLETVPAAYAETWLPAGFEIQHRQEIFLGERVSSCTRKAAEGEMLHTLTRENGSEAARARSRWTRIRTNDTGPVSGL